MKVLELKKDEVIILTNLLSSIKKITSKSAEKIIALSTNLELSVKESFDLEVSSYDNCIIEYSNKEYLVCTESQAEDKWNEGLESYIEEYILPQMAEELQNYFDDVSWKRDAKNDGRDHSLSSYDFIEYEESVNDETYYIYRTN
jgi:hypothetical protein